MSVSYDKLFRLLRRRGMKPVDLRRATDIAPNTFTKLRKNEIVNMEILMRIAVVLQCDIGDICSFVYVEDNEKELL